VAALFEPDVVGDEGRAACRAGGAEDLGVAAPGKLFYIALPEAEVPVVAGGGAEALAEGLLLGGVLGQAAGQVEAAADVRGVERVGQGVVEGAVGGQAQPGDDALQRQAVPLLAGVLAEKDLLQIIPDGGMALVQVA